MTEPVSKILGHLDEFLHPKSNQDPSVVRSNRLASLQAASAACGLGPFAEVPPGSSMNIQRADNLQPEIGDQIDSLVKTFRLDGITADSEVEAKVKELVTKIKTKASSR